MNVTPHRQELLHTTEQGPVIRTVRIVPRAKARGFAYEVQSRGESKHGRTEWATLFTVATKQEAERLVELVVGASR